MVQDILKSVWPEWELGKRIGGGSYGVVHEAVRMLHGVESRAAIKVISIPSDESELDSLLSEGLDMEGSRRYLRGIVDDFVGEIRMLEALQGSANIVNVMDYQVVEKTEEVGWYIFIRMELLTPLSMFLCDKKLSEADVIKLGCDICTALDVCEHQNIIHRDIKPGNIMVHKTGDFKLGDFGIARSLENATAGKYSPNYVAPEVVNGSRYDGRADIYSLGLVLYRLMNGDRLPFLEEKQLRSPGELSQALERRIRGEALPVPCEASAELSAVILRACAFDPAHRYATAAEMKAALQSVASRVVRLKETGQIDKTTAVRRVVEMERAAEAPKAKRKKSGRIIVLLFALVGLIAAAIAAAGLMRGPERASEETEMTMILVKNRPTKTEYSVGDMLDTSGLSVTALYSDGSSEVISSGFACDPMTLDTAGTQTITVSYGDETASFVVEVREKMVYELSVENMPTNSTYSVGDVLDTSGLSLTVTYQDGSTETISDGFICEPTTLSSAGEETITVSYGGKSATFTVTVKHPLTAPDLKVKNNETTGKIVLTWEAVTGANSYEVWYSTVKDDAYKVLCTTEKLQITHNDVVPGVIFYYMVRAVSGEEYSEFSKIVARTCVLATPKLSIGGDADSGKPVVAWEKVDGATGYEIWRSTEKTGEFTLISTIQGTKFTNDSATPGVTYYYKVRAICDANSTVASAFSSLMARTCDLERPKVTVTLNANGKPVLTWEAVSGAVKYEIYRATEKNGNYIKIYTTTGLKLTNSSAESGVTYYYKIKAICTVSAGNSAFSVVKSITSG